ncbi:glycosyl transferase [Photobacterium aquae]|uniref:Cellulose synthase catalytic subunit [UDP-forming] n=2 Tax=Photobacterium aquae TaxID=1195763 RepID=A0A0J1GV66_9GAMM|nr:glycosyl transferase [Photobacterium aquae]
MKWLASCLLTVAVLYLATIEVAVETHLWLSVSALLVVLLCMTSSEKKYLNLVMLLTGAFISLRYIWWRYDETLPWESSLDIPFALALFITEIYGISIYLIGMFVNVKQRNRKIIPIDEKQDIPSVDVFIPTFNEPLHVVGPTIAAASQLHYPGTVNVWVLDDGGTAQKLNAQDHHQAKQARERTSKLKALCQQLGVEYLTRPDNSHAKAGNINHALAHNQGELVLILDADHVPSRDFLVNTVGQFQHNSNLGFVQTPHFFVTPNPIERNLGIEDKVPAENEMFYNRILKGMDFWNASFFCGSAAVIRRKALEDVGGISTRTITEDADTAINIHAKGWDSAYINKAMIAGLSPDTFGAYVTQRSRWAQGMIQIFMLNNPLFKRGLSWPQKLCYLNSTSFWFFPLFRVVYLLAPLAYLLFDLQIFVGNAGAFVAYAIPHLIISILINQHLFGKTRNTLFSEFYETILSLFLFLPVLSVIISPRKPSFAVTPKGETTENTHFSGLTPALLVLTIVLTVAECWGLYRYYHFPIEQGQLAIVLVFNTLNLLISLLCLGSTLEKRQRRIEPRIQSNVQAHVAINNKQSTATINNASLSGANLTIHNLDDNLQHGDIVELTCYVAKPKQSQSEKAHLKPYRFAMRIHQATYLANGQSVHCELMDKNTQSLAVFTDIAYGFSRRWEVRRQFEEQQKKSILHALGNFIQLSVRSLTTVLKASLHNQRPDPAKPAGSPKATDSTQDVRQ